MKKILLILLAWMQTLCLFAQDAIITKNETGAFPIVAGKKATGIYVSTTDHWLVQKAAALLQTDIEKVTGTKPDTSQALPPSAKNIIIIGSLDQSPLIHQLVQTKKLQVNAIKGKWEAFQLQVVSKPWPGIDNALVIAGSDKRGTAYGVFELSKQLGVSPWYWWADVPVKTNPELWYKSAIRNQQSPGVTYRGIFLNDEAPALSGWSKATFGGFNHLFYEKVFELLLRLKANYLWPAMWGNAFYDDDTLNPVLADQYGIVIGTSHHEPMLRAHDEWRRYGTGKWNYDSNEVQLKKFWEQGIRRNRNYESIVSVGMRGDGDMPMSQQSNIALLERIVADQRKIIANVTGKNASATPQMWALYKEVQDYYDKGMRVPDDITLLLCDDNWGNIRKLPKWNAPKRTGGYGIYYHFDYVGGPRNYKWINTNTLARTWEQMHLAYEYGVNRIWIVNVGDLKPMELPISFFLDYAWAPSQYTTDHIRDYTANWANQQFDNGRSDLIGYLLSKYTQYNSRRKPELLSPDTYSQVNYQEAENAVKEYNKLTAMADSIGRSLPAQYQDAYYQLVLFPIKASANLNALYAAAGKNYLYAKQERAATNDLADSIRKFYLTDSLLTIQYNKVMANGKWDHMMDQTHIGYTYWQQPPVNKMPEVKTITLMEKASMGVSIPGTETVWPNDSATANLPAMNNITQGLQYIDVFNRGTTPFTYSIETNSWLHLSATNGQIAKEERIQFFVEWSAVPVGKHRVPITINGPDKNKVTVFAILEKLHIPGLKNQTAVECDGHIAMEADQYNNKMEEKDARWQHIDFIGRTGNGMTIFPTSPHTASLKPTSAHLEYDLFTTDSGATKVMLYCSPTLPFNESTGLRYAVSFDNQTPQIINLHADNSEKAWAQSVSDNIRISTSTHNLLKAGRHTLKIWAVDPGIVLQKIVVDWGGVKQCYLGPPSFQRAEGREQKAETPARQQ
ncbi:glycosyl hydrolase [Niastella yeongjuensis]|uniref:Glycosyl hydrolase n=1 Tax=Niastella yeongjuensis TaxID=354355 RepID=A0A1V9F509_9BACT|nr:glycosyl hydrolase 115 family protein [Niastella yeongjuensis]OQP53347.1 glycosyl hydrolase [Niastella yeongjuensis]SEP14402.1 Glycosyl hydrolase family 115 [Niastella yeongjuensis]